MDGVEGQYIVGSGDRPVVLCNGVDALGGNEGELVLHRRWKCAWELGARGHGAVKVSRSLTSDDLVTTLGTMDAHGARVMANAKKGILAVGTSLTAVRLKPIKVERTLNVKLERWRRGQRWRPFAYDIQKASRHYNST